MYRHSKRLSTITNNKIEQLLTMYCNNKCYVNVVSLALFFKVSYCAVLTYFQTAVDHW